MVLFGDGDGHLTHDGLRSNVQIQAEKEMKKRDRWELISHSTSKSKYVLGKGSSIRV